MRDAAAEHFFREGYLNVRSAPYGAKGDGVADDSAAFVAAIQDAYANNLVVYVPTGTYLISRQLRLVQTAQGGFRSEHFPGDQRARTPLQCRLPGTLAIDMGNNPTGTALSMPGAQYCVIEDVEISGNFDAGIYRLPGSGGSVTNVRIAGGRIGILQDRYRPNPLITLLFPPQQRKALHESMLDEVLDEPVVSSRTRVNFRE
jgi:hypothetical protein